ncbi:MAG: Shikimate dehydrogenase [Parcubacteria group bacterium GW2011_GWA2_44_12]|nr:MAG: Shikimate dehydrogenase [Parcubacteria group bacterium GW2011_GWA2_44_12]
MNINASTKICAIIGKPLSHTMSPTVHNAAISALKINIVFIPLECENLNSAIAAMKAFGFLAYAVTMPYKREVIDYLDAVDPRAKKLSSVNTVINRKGKLIGYNTDIEGIEKSLAGVALKRKIALVIGAGGAARSAAYALREKGAEVFIVNRTTDEGSALAEECEAHYIGGLDIFTNYPKDLPMPKIIINATPLGMGRLARKSPVPSSFLKKGMAIFDLIYNPRITNLLKDARKNGCVAIHGDTMFLHQAGRQFELYSGLRAPFLIMQRAMKKRLLLEK